MLLIVKLPSTWPVPITCDSRIATSEDIIVETINWVLKLIVPPPALIEAEPIISPTFILTISNDPSLDVNNAVDISGSLGSWLTSIVKSDKLSQSVLDKVTFTVGVKSIQGSLPVLPPTQLPQSSI